MYFIRIGKIPIDEKSKIFFNGEYIVGEEDGVSVFSCIKYEHCIDIRLPLPLTENILNCLLQLWYYPDEPIYLVKGTPVGLGKDNEPLIKNVEIVEEIDRETFLSDSFRFENIDTSSIERDKTYYIKLNDIDWRMTIKPFYEKFEGKKIILEHQMLPQMVEEEYIKVHNKDIDS